MMVIVLLLTLLLLLMLLRPLRDVSCVIARVAVFVIFLGEIIVTWVSSFVTTVVVVVVAADNIKKNITRRWSAIIGISR